MYGLVKEDYERAAKNGIKRHTLENRVYTLLWEHERAVTEPVDKRIKECKWNQYKAISVVSRSSFDRRVKKGMDPELAATKPPEKKGRYTEEDVKIAAENGISLNTLKQRIYHYKKPIEEAISQPLHHNRGKGLRKRKVSRAHWNYIKGL